MIILCQAAWHDAQKLVCSSLILGDLLTGLVYSEAEWESEWSNVLRLSSTKPRNNAPDTDSK